MIPDKDEVDESQFGSHPGERLATPGDLHPDRREAIMPARSGRELTPRQSVELECARRGESAVVTGCVALGRRRG
jgi:hypothetical protein